MGAQERLFAGLPAEGEAQPQLLRTLPEIVADGSPCARYAAALAEDGAHKLIENVRSEAMVLRSGDLRLPVTLEDGGYGASYVANPHSNYVLYARDEIDIIGLRAGRTAAKGVLGLLDGLLRSIGVSRTVHLDNWLLSTNLHGEWKGEYLPALRAHLTEAFPDRFVVIRSLDPWSCPELLEAVKADGWTIMPARQIWVTDDLARDWKKRNNSQNDRRALKKSGLLVEEPSTITPADAQRIAELYRALYIGRYSGINPVFTARFIEVAASTGLLHFRLARSLDGQIMAACGMRAAGGIGTVPLLGYDMERPQSEGLYRIATYLASEWAMERGLRFNGSAGAAEFKKMRGARGQIEYMAVYGRHLAATRRAGLGILSASLNGLMKPMLERTGW